MLQADLCIIGGGAAGLATAMAGVALGLQVTLVEKAPAEVVSGDLDLIAEACRAEAAAGAAFNPERLTLRVDRVLEASAPDRRMERLAAMNVRVCIGSGRFVDRNTLSTGVDLIRARRFVIATGRLSSSPPGIPPDQRLNLVALSRRRSLPEHLLVVGGEARAASIAQAYRSFGAAVTLLCPRSLLPGVDEEIVAPLRRRLRRHGVALAEAGANDIRFVREGTQVAATWASGKARSASHVLVEDAVPSLSGLDLDRAGVAAENGCLHLTPSLRTTNTRVFAVGAVTGIRSSAAIAPQVAVVMKAAFFRLPARFGAASIPLTARTDPEIAVVGLSEAAARARGPVSVWRAPLAETSAARLQGMAEGHVKVICDRRGRVLGAGVVGSGAAEQIAFWSLALASRASMQSLSSVALPTDSFGAASRALIGAAAAARLKSGWVRRVLSLTARLD